MGNTVLSTTSSPKRQMATLVVMHRGNISHHALPAESQKLDLHKVPCHHGNQGILCQRIADFPRLEVTAQQLP